MSSYPTVRLADAPITIIDGDKSPNYPKTTEFLKQGECLFLNSNNINENKLVLHNVNYISKDKYNAISKGKLEQDDVILTIGGSKLGNVALYTLHNQKAIINAQMLLLRVDKSALDPDFLYFQLIAEEFQSNIQRLITGSAQPQLSIKDLKEIHILLPPMRIQRQIVNICKSFQNKVDSCIHQNEKLHELIIALFQKWFLSKTKEWKIACFGDIVDEITEKVDSVKTLANTYAVLSPVSSGNLVPSDEYSNKQAFNNDITKYKVLHRYDFAYNPARVNMGSIGMLEKEINGCVSPIYIAFRPKPNWQYFISLMLKQTHIQKAIEVYCSGSVRQVLRFEDFCRIEFYLPPIELVKQFNAVYDSIRIKHNHNVQMQNELNRLIELAFPKLLSGNIALN